MTKGIPRFTTQRRTLYLALGIVMLVLASTLAIYLTRSKPSPVPADIYAQVDFPVFYPEPSKLPDGYSLDTNSFSATEQALVYAINHGADEKLAVTVQQRPPKDKIDQFSTSQLSTPREVLTPFGTATIGVIGDRTLISLPTNNQAWVLMTAPSDIDKDAVNEILLSLTSE